VKANGKVDGAMAAERRDLNRFREPEPPELPGFPSNGKAVALKPSRHASGGGSSVAGDHARQPPGCRSARRCRYWRGWIPGGKTGRDLTARCEVIGQGRQPTDRFPRPQGPGAGGPTCAASAGGNLALPRCS